MNIFIILTVALIIIFVLGIICLFAAIAMIRKRHSLRVKHPEKRYISLLAGGILTMMLGIFIPFASFTSLLFVGGAAVAVSANELSSIGKHPEFDQNTGRMIENDKGQEEIIRYGENGAPIVDPNRMGGGLFK